MQSQLKAFEGLAWKHDLAIDDELPRRGDENGFDKLGEIAVEGPAPTRPLAWQPRRGGAPLSRGTGTCR